MRNKVEDVIIKQLISHLISTINKIIDRRLEMNADQPWANSVPIPLKLSILTNPFLSPKLKPNLVFEYS